jgi:hypothetical protein
VVPFCPSLRSPFACRLTRERRLCFCLDLTRAGALRRPATKCQWERPRVRSFLVRQPRTAPFPSPKSIFPRACGAISIASSRLHPHDQTSLMLFSFRYQWLAADRAEKIRARKLALAARSHENSRATSAVLRPNAKWFFIHNGAPSALIGCSAFATAFSSPARRPCPGRDARASGDPGPRND